MLGNGGTTVFWDVATFGLIERRSEHLVFGEFSTKFADASAAAPHLDEPVVVAEPNRAITRSPSSTTSVDLYALTHNETSTGVAMDLRRPAAPTDALVAVDATSAAGGLPWDPAQVDVYYFAPQKCFASDGGLWLAACSPAAVDAHRAHRGRRSVAAGLARPRHRPHQQPPRPDVQHPGRRARWCCSRPSCAGCSTTAGSTGASSAAGRRRTTCTRGPRRAVGDAVRRRSRPSGRQSSAPIDLDGTIDAGKVNAALRANGIVDTDSYRKLGRNQLRIGMFPAVEPADVEALTACIDHLVEHHGDVLAP